MTRDEGEPGGAFYVVESGRVAVLDDGSEIRRLRPGYAFGEIALLRSVPRTATVLALDDTELAVLSGRSPGCRPSRRAPTHWSTATSRPTGSGTPARRGPTPAGDRARADTPQADDARSSTARRSANSGGR